MPAANAPLYAFNRGLISPLGLARADLKRTALSAEVQRNWIPRALGSMTLRPGMQNLGSVNSNGQPLFLDFEFSTTDLALVELTDYAMRVWVDDAVVTRPYVDTTITNGTFTTTDTGWTDDDTGGSAASTVTGGFMTLTGDGTEYARRYQEVSVSATYNGTRHALHIEVTRGPVDLRVGSTQGDSDYIQATLLTGSHSLAFTPVGASFFVQMENGRNYSVLVSSIAVESSGPMVITTPWAEGDLDYVRYDQSGDVLFIAHESYQQRRIERRDTDSWSVVNYTASDGPYRVENTSAVTIAASATTGNVSLTASQPLFKSGHIGALFTTTVSSTRGVVLITDVASSTSASAVVLKTLGGTGATATWSEGAWSDYRGWPSAVCLYESRLFWAGRGSLFGSVSDAYDDFDPDTAGDSGPLNRTIGAGPVDRINWLIPQQRLLLGAEGSEKSVRSSSLDEPLTPTNLSIKGSSTQGTGRVTGRKVDGTAIYVDRSSTRVFELAFKFEPNDYVARELSILVPRIGEPDGFVRLAVQRRPDTRIHCVRPDGTVALLLLNSTEDILCWVTVSTNGYIRDVITLPGTIEDHVYYAVERVIDGATVVRLEKWAREDQSSIFSYLWEGDSSTEISLVTTEGTQLFADGTVVTVRDKTGNKVENLTVTSGAITLSTAATYAHITPALCYLADSYETYSGSATSTITGLNNLNGVDVVVWADGRDQGTFTVSGSSITLDESVEEAVIGLGYSAYFQSAKLAYAHQLGTALTQVKKVDHIGFILMDTHQYGVQYGRDFDNLFDLTQVVDGRTVALEHVHHEFDQPMQEFPGQFSTDERVCLVASAPRPATVLAAVISIDTHDYS